jgi:ABC-type uncharacterized transport system permease subunit
MPEFWLKIALVLYGVGLLYSLLAITRRSHFLAKVTLPAMQTGMVFHLVSLVETARVLGHYTPYTLHDVESCLAFVVMVFFTIIRARYHTATPGVFIFPPVFVLTFAAAIGKQPPQFSLPMLRNGWIVVHIVLILTGYAALLFSFVASILYLMGERALKSKRKGGFASRLPSLDTIDQIGYRSLQLGFPFMTFGLIVGAAVAQTEFGLGFFLDPKVLLSVLMWAVYMVLLFTRWNIGWRGRRAALLASVAFLAAIGAWAANYFSSVHRFIAS